jgi:NitT/TauT family transport system substrate-binding protein
MQEQAEHDENSPDRCSSEVNGPRFGADMRLRRLMVQGAAALAALALVACSQAPNPPLTVGLNAWVGNDPLVLARDRKLLDPQQVKVVELSSNSETLRNFRNGLLDAASLTLDETLRLADEGIDLRVVAVMDTSNGADLVLVDPSIQTLSDLRGASIAVEGTTVGALMLQRLLQAAGLTQADVQVVNLEAPQHLAALRSHRVSAAVSYEPVAGELRAAGFKGIFDSRQMPGEVVDVLIVRGDLLQARMAQVEALLDAWQAGLQALLEDPGAAAQQLAPGTSLTPDEYLATIKSLTLHTPAQSLDLLTGEPSLLEQNTVRLVSTLQATGFLKGPPDWSRLIVSEPAQRLQARRGQP